MVVCGDVTDALVDGHWRRGVIRTCAEENGENRYGVAVDGDLENIVLADAIRPVGEGVMTRSYTEALQGAPQQTEKPKPRIFVLDGQRFESEDEFLEAAAALRRKQTTAVRIDLENSEALDEEAHKLFRSFASAESTLQLNQVHGFVESMAAQIGLHPKVLGDPSHLFWRHDFSGDGQLDEEECCQLVKGMLRIHRDKTATEKVKGRKMMNINKKKLDSMFKLERKLGQGGQGAVHLATERKTGKERVVKFFRKGNVNAPLDDIRDEFKLLTKLDHPQIQRLYDIFEDHTYCYLISEPYYGGDLQDLVPRATEKGVSVSTRWLGLVVQQVVQGVAFLHTKRIMHCDLKEANAVLVGRDMVKPAVVVIDFGLADKLIGEGAGMSGTPGYMPPEVWTAGLWTPKGDVHSLGVMIYQMFTGERCFPASTLQECRQKTCSAPIFEEPLKGYTNLPELLRLMLNKKFGERPTAAKVLEAPFFQSLNDTPISQKVLDALTGLKRTSDVQNAILTDIAALENLAKFRDLNRAFLALDTNGDGVISEDDFRKRLGEILSPEHMQPVIDALIGDDGMVAYTRFMGQVLLAADEDVENTLWREFEALDKDSNGQLTSEEIATLLKRPNLARLVDGGGPEELMRLMDKDESGLISFEEFCNAVRGDRREPAPPVAGPATKTSHTTVDVEDETAPVTWKSTTLINNSTERSMWEHGITPLFANIATMLCCFWWVPVVFFMGAANVTEDCEDDTSYSKGYFSTWMKTVPIVFVVFGPLVHVFIFLFAKAGVGLCFRFGTKLLCIVPIVNLALGIQGIVLHVNVEDNDCVENSSGVNPVVLALVWGLICLPLLCTAACFAASCINLRKMRESAAAEQKVKPIM
eukprot:TRINITY_DN38232_c0_g1_i1.p1 TRINITY_DN38232_c0_g1~~TRINITY_DN38232_c0_g1_i1.p1  ORF type:complete len:869 (-),score=159.65 TRINITY_DN38232_c0_g1_i1:61-2667(-)